MLVLELVSLEDASVELVFHCSQIPLQLLQPFGLLLVLADAKL